MIHFNFSRLLQNNAMYKQNYMMMLVRGYKNILFVIAFYDIGLSFAM